VEDLKQPLNLADRYIQSTCATTGEGLYEGLDWLSSNIASKVHIWCRFICSCFSLVATCLHCIFDGVAVLNFQDIWICYELLDDDTWGYLGMGCYSSM
jgi:hypothetical protein